MQRTAGFLFVLLLVACACGGSSATSSQPRAASPSLSPSAAATANPARVIFDRSEAVMLTLGYTVHRQWLKPQPQTVAPVQWKPGQAPETTMVAIDSPAYSLSSTADTSPHCPNAICTRSGGGTQHGSSPSCTPAVDAADATGLHDLPQPQPPRGGPGRGDGGGCQQATSRAGTAHLSLVLAPYPLPPLRVYRSPLGSGRCRAVNGLLPTPDAPPLVQRALQAGPGAGDHHGGDRLARLPSPRPLTPPALPPTRSVVTWSGWRVPSGALRPAARPPC